MMVAPFTPELWQLRQRNASTVTGWNQDVSDRGRVSPGSRKEACGDVEPPLAFEQRADGPSADRQFHHVLHIPHVDAEPGDLSAVDADAELRLLRLLLESRVSRSATCCSTLSVCWPRLRTLSDRVH